MTATVLRYLVLWAFIFSAGVRAQDLAGELDLDLDDEFAADNLTSWWHADWPYRRILRLPDPDAAVAANGRIRLPQLQPLLMANCDRIRLDGADLRVVDGRGKVLKAGVQHPGDDQESYIWIEVPSATLDGVVAKQQGQQYALYYGNLDVTTPPETQLADEAREVPMLIGEREHQGEPPPAPPVAEFFRGLLVVDTDDWRDPEGRAPIFTRVVEPGFLFKRRSEDATGTWYLDLRHMERREGDEPFLATADIDVPEAGRWYVHMRRAKIPKRGLNLKPFTLEIGGESFTPKLESNILSPIVSFYWSSVAVDLEAGPQQMRLVMPASPGLDCVILSRDPDYVPDVKDIAGPVYFRFRLPADSPVESAFFRLFSVIIPWSSHGPQGEVAGWVFRHETVRADTDYQELHLDPANGIPRGEWSPWVASLESEAPMWWCQVSAHIPGVRDVKGYGDAVPAIDFQLATRPDENRVFRSGRERGGQVNTFFFTMPSSNDLATTLEKTMSYGQKSQQRFAATMDLLGEDKVKGPEKIFVTTMGSLRGPDEIVPSLKVLEALGFNGSGFRTVLDRDAYIALAAQHGVAGSMAHHWYPKTVEYGAWPDSPPAGQTARDYAEAKIRASAVETYAPPSHYGQAHYEQLRLIIMGDEIGPATNAYLINAVPLMKQWFHDFMRDHGMTPADFGHENWADIDAYEDKPLRVGSELYIAINAIRAARGEEALDDGLPEPPPLDAPPTWHDTSDMELDEATMDAELEAQMARTKQAAQVAETPEQKRLVYWMTRFMSHYTNRFYGIAGAEIDARIAAGDMPLKPYASPNFQASPIMTTQMWNGAPNIFEWGRARATNALLIEDWIVDPHRVGFGTRVMQTAARDTGQPYGLLIVGGRMKTRAIMHLATGGSLFDSYLYGPERVIGPPWADHLPTIQQWAELNTALGRFEDDILAAKPRPTRVAMLFAVTSDINSRYGGYVYHGRHQRERGDLYSLLLGAHVATELICEEEILDTPDVLKHYDLIYVVDPHVRTEVQDRLKSWVADGGHLWASYAALSRDQYDEPTNRFDEVFGLTSRATPQPVEPGFDPETEARTVQVPAADGLDAIRYQTSPAKPDWTLTADATVLASFADDGSPALVRHPYGKGQAYLYGSTILELTSGYSRITEEPADAPAKRKLATIAAAAAQIPDQAWTSHPRLLAQISDGPTNSLLFIACVADQDLAAVSVHATVPWKPARITRGDGSDIPFTYTDGTVTFQTDIAMEDGHIYRLDKE